MPEVVIADTSCFIALSRIDALQLLEQVYGSVRTTRRVAEEFGRELPAWISIEELTDEAAYRTLALQLDPGEASAIALALELPGATIILDDRKGRMVAAALGLPVTGTLGVVVKAKQKGIVPAFKPWLDRFKMAGFRCSEELEAALLKEAGEHP